MFNSDLMVKNLASAEQRDLYNFSKDLGKAGLQIAEMHGTSSDRWLVLCSLFTYTEKGLMVVFISRALGTLFLMIKPQN